MTKSIYEQMKDAGVEVDNHESDLYVPVNDVTRPLVAGYEFKNNVTTFSSNIDHAQWYEPFPMSKFP